MNNPTQNCLNQILIRSGSSWSSLVFWRIYVHTHEVSHGDIFEKKSNTLLLLLLLKLRVPIHPRDGVNRIINHMVPQVLKTPTGGE